MSKKPKIVGFTINPRITANLWAQDPTVREDMIRGINDADEGKREPMTTSVGSANLAAGEDVEPIFASIFFSTNQAKKVGEAGKFYRNVNFSGDGTRIQARIKEQTWKKEKEIATPGEVLVAPKATPAAVEQPAENTNSLKEMLKEAGVDVDNLSAEEVLNVLQQAKSSKKEDVAPKRILIPRPNVATTAPVEATEEKVPPLIQDALRTM